jgi:asparagine synthase (glutamine-hydrolysing)
MCGIAGWVDFARDLIADRGAVEAMTRTMACRGPDDEGIWLDRHVALGHRRLAVIDLEGGRQPMAEDGLAVLSYSGEIYNFAELRGTLEAKGHRFRTGSDTEVLLRGYLEWGEEVVSRLNGMFAFALWDARREELLLVRDRLGIKPLFYYPLPDGVLFGSEPKAILAHPLAVPVVDADGLREQLTLMVATPERAVFKGMFELRPGCLLRVRREGLVKRCYWALEAHERSDDLITTIRTIRELLEDIVARQLVSDVPICTLLSGGLDSSAITALASRHGQIRSFSVDFAGYAENFTPDEIRGDADGPYAELFVRHVRPDHDTVVLDTTELTDPRLRAAVVRAWDRAHSLGDMNTSLYMLFRAIRERSTVALSGQSADEVFGGYAWFHQREAVKADTFPWLAALTRDHTPADLIDRDLLGQLDLPTFIADSYQMALAEVPRLEGEVGLERRMREVCYLHLTRWLVGLLDRKDRMSMASGLEVRVPFCDHRLVEYVFNTSWAFKTFDGREKSLLRAAVADLVPGPILKRVKSPYPATQNVAYERALRGTIGQIAEQRKAPVAPLLDRVAVKEITTTPAPETTSTVTRLALETALDLNVWLEAYSPRIDI